MDFRDLVMDRHSVREYDPHRTIPEEQMQLILDAAVQAPSACNRQPFTIYRLTSPEMRERAVKWYPRPYMADVSELLLIVGEDDEAYVYPDKLDNTVYTDTAIAIDYMQLQAWDLGIASLWINGFDRPLCASDLSELGLRMGHRTPVAMLALGYLPDDVKRPVRKRKSPDELIKTI